MARNPYISQTVRSEQNLYEDIIIESIKIYGQDIEYLPRTLVAEDQIFGEDVISRFDNAYTLEMYLENTEGFDGDGDLFTKFGVEIRDRATLHVARRRWEVVVGAFVDNNRPNEGDLIYLPLSDQVFEITRVTDDTPFYQLSNLPTYRLDIELFEYNGENFDTGNSDVDDIEKDFGYQFALTLTDSNYPLDAFQTGTTIKQSLAGSVIISGEVADWSDSSNKLSLVNIGANDGKYHQFTTGIISDSDNKLFTVVSVQEDNKLAANEQNNAFESFGDGIIDFSEGNPFGEVT